MLFNIRGNKIEVTDAIRDYIEKKIGKLNKYFNNPEEITASVVIKTSGINQIVEITIPIKKTILRAEERNKDLYSAIDLVLEKLERQIRKNKTRMKKQKEVINVIADFEISDEEIKEDKITKRKYVESKPMSEEEAILQMNLIDHDFFIFKNTDKDNVSVVYKRKDNNYGIIEIN